MNGGQDGGGRAAAQYGGGFPAEAAWGGMLLQTKERNRRLVVPHFTQPSGVRAAAAKVFRPGWARAVTAVFPPGPVLPGERGSRGRSGGWMPTHGRPFPSPALRLPLGLHIIEYA